MVKSLYECSHARVKGNIYCEKRHELTSITDGISILRLVRGNPLIFAICQECPDFLSMGDPIPKSERGWLDNLGSAGLSIR